MELLAAITEGPDAFLAFTVMIIAMYVILVFTIDR
jgi:hypothetical protein